jgi:thiol-disulfide isomerase/thioredoxin
MQGKSRVLLPVVAALFAAAGCSGGSSVSQSVDDSFGIQGSQLNIADLSSHHSHVKPISGKTLAGQPLTVTPGGGKVLVVNFWGDWCAPCNAEEQGFVQVANDDKSKDVEFLGVAEKEQGTAAALDFEKKFNVSYPSLNDTDGSIELGFPTPAIPAETPTTLVIDRSGEVVAKVTGILPYTDLNTLINHVLGQST